MELNFPKIEEEILKYWRENKIFEKSIENRAKPKKLFGLFAKKPKNFVFYEGPPTANAKPGIHHVLARVFKDIICRYKTMRGFLVLRKAGWDTHGLPVELEIEKKLGFKSKQDIEKFGIAEFSAECKKSVWEYKGEWEKLTERIGFWLQLEHPYITYENDYIETLWWIIKKIWRKGLLYQDYKVIPYCPRCQTTLSSHEVAQGYKKIKEPAIYVKFQIHPPKFSKKTRRSRNFKFQILNSETHLLVWTTTPWTLPGNVAVAINPEFNYVLAKVGFENFILLKEKVGILKDYQILKEFKGKELLGLKYDPLYLACDLKDYPSAWQVIGGDFVSQEEGTGLVHIAPAFGEEDLELIKMMNSKIQNPNLKFPILMTVDEAGYFKPQVEKWQGMFVKEADSAIIKDLKERDLLFQEEIYEHDYPFCWRCDSPLIYYAKPAWFIKMTRVRKKLIENNKKINWVPGHLKEGRFGEWLQELKDWAFSRERYWGTPLPIWQCQRCKKFEVIGSKSDLIAQKFSKNKYLLLRHGHSTMNAQNIIISTLPEKIECPLTKEGEKEIREAAQKLKKEKVDLIFSSDLLRTVQTAEIISQELGIKEINFDERLRDIQAGIYDGKTLKEYHSFWQNLKERFNKRPPEGESYNDVKLRILQFLKEIEQNYEGKTILLIGHQRPFDMLRGAVLGLKTEEFLEKIELDKIKTGELREIELKFLPYNREGELDFHRPYIDEVEFFCPNCQRLMKRVPEVIDCWFDSGAMPFAQGHWPFAQKQKSKPPELFPADYISEAVDQTRGWFYTLLAISTLLDFGRPYKNVISLGHVLDQKGEKMSKSKGNVVDPWQMISEYGADAIRWYFFTINQPGDPKLFSEEDLRESFKKFIIILWNSYLFHKTYKSGLDSQVQISKNILDRWIISKLNNLIQEVTQKLDNYDIVSAARMIEKFTLDDLSRWYIRRSRERFQPGFKPNLAKNKKDFEEASKILGYALLSLTKLSAPFIPFLSEKIYQEIKNRSYILPAKDRAEYQKSLHLEDWPKFQKKFIDKNLERKMDLTRQICSLGLKLRAKAGIKVRQPLASLKIQSSKFKVQKEFLDLIKDELNIEEIEVVKEITKEIKSQKNWLIETEEKITLALNIEINQELKEKGLIREIIRMVQEMRKIAGFGPEDEIIIQFKTSPTLENLIEKNKNLIQGKTLAKDLVSQTGEVLIEREIELAEEKIWLGIREFKKKIESKV